MSRRVTLILAASLSTAAAVAAVATSVWSRGEWRRGRDELAEATTELRGCLGPLPSLRNRLIEAQRRDRAWPRPCVGSVDRAEVALRRMHHHCAGDACFDRARKLRDLTSLRDSFAHPSRLLAAALTFLGDPHPAPVATRPIAPFVPEAATLSHTANGGLSLLLQRREHHVARCTGSPFRCERLPTSIPIGHFVRPVLGRDAFIARAEDSWWHHPLDRDGVPLHGTPVSTSANGVVTREKDAYRWRPWDTPERTRPIDSSFPPVAVGPYVYALHRDRIDAIDAKTGAKTTLVLPLGLATDARVTACSGDVPTLLVRSRGQHALVLDTDVQSLPAPRRGSWGLACDGRRAHLLAAYPPDVGSKGELELRQLTCTQQGCVDRTGAIPLDRPHPSSRYFFASIPGGDVAVVWQSPLLDIRLRRGPIAELAAAPFQAFADDADFGGLRWRDGYLELVAGPKGEVRLIAETANHGVTALALH